MTVELHPSAAALHRKTEMWKALVIDEDPQRAAEMASALLQDHFAFDAVHVAGLALAKLDHEEAFDWCCMSLTLSKAKEEWYANCAKAFMDKKDWLHAMLFIENGIKAHPDSVTLSYQRGTCLCHAGDWDRAEAALNETHEKFPDFTHALMTLGFVYQMQGRYEESIALYRQLEPKTDGIHHEDIVNNWACVLMEQGKQVEALAILDSKCADQDRPATVYNKSFMYLGLGRWPEAWHMYRQRLKVQKDGQDQGVPDVPLPVPETLQHVHGKHVFLYHEQGLGDTLQFIRYALLLREHCDLLTIGVPRSMARIAGRLMMDPDYRVICGEDHEKDEAIIHSADYAVPMLHCPSLFNQRTNNIPSERYFLPVPDVLLAKRDISHLCREGVKRVGLVWAGAGRPDNIRAHSIDKRRSIGFEAISPLLDLADCADFVSLQLPDHKVDDPRVIEVLQSDFDVLDTCAVIEQLDLVIAIDSSVAHMAAAFGHPTWMLSRYDQCWRWFWDGRTTTDWYPSMRIYQQSAPGDWQSVIARIREELSDFLLKGSCRA